MPASFTSALPYRAPSSQRGGRQFRQRSLNLTPNTRSPPDPSSPSTYSPFQDSDTVASSTATVTLVKHSAPRQVSSYFSSELDLVQSLGSHASDVPSANIREPHTPSSSQDAHGALQTTDSKAPDISFRDGFSLSDSISSPPRKLTATYIQRLRRIFHQSKESTASPSRSASTDYGRPAPVQSNASTSSVRHVDPLLEHEATTVSYESSMMNSLYPNDSEQILLTTPNIHSLISFATAGATTAILASPRMLNSIGRTTANFTRKFPTPWKTSTSSDGHGFVPLIDNKDDFSGIEDGKSLYLNARSRQKHDGLGLDGDTLEIGRWTLYKWVLTLSVLVIFGMGLGGMLLSLGFWLRTWSRADVIQVIDWDILLYTTVASGCLLLTSLVGLTGALLNSRPLLAFYNILLWPSLISTATIGYASYKRRTYNLDGKMNEGWSRNWDDLGRLIIQNSLHCCGLYNPLHQATFSARCYPRSPLPGCKFKLLRFQAQTLDYFTRAAFTSVGIVLISIVVAILCSNHVTRLFGKGLMPRQYRLRLADVQASARLVGVTAEPSDIWEEQVRGRWGLNRPTRMHKRKDSLEHGLLRGVVE